MTGSRDRREHYAVLGVEPTASARQVTSAYRTLVRLLHPDSRPREPGSAERLGAVVAAYEVLHDPELRAAYDAGRESVRVVRETGGAGSVHAAPTPPGAAMRHGSEPLIRAGPIRIEPPGASAWARDDPGDLWEWIQHRLWEVDPWL
ncbi:MULTISPECIES: J domain-containing protein [unclassified Kitasatospora]|uniref:J domain-containing protein n=1 Tax=unclassified Kitasatospora TaxID=2633591 RepID=UPI0033C4C4FB